MRSVNFEEFRILGNLNHSKESDDSLVICTGLGPRGRKGQEVCDGAGVGLVSLVPLTTD